MSTFRRSILLASLALLAWPALARPQEPLGIVTTLSGQATRTASTRPGAATPLRFKDGIFGADTIRTAERSFVRMLLERKAVLTIRELSVLHVTEDARQATVDLRSGGIAFSVARPRLRPGETVLIHTPNAVAAVRGTSIVVESQGAVTHFHVLTGTLDVASRANPTAWQRLQAPASLTVTGAVVGAVRALDDRTRDRLSADYLGLRVAEPRAPAEVVAQEQAKAVLLARLISGDGAGDDDRVELLAVPEISVGQAAPGMQSSVQAPVIPPLTPGAPSGTPGPPPGPLQTWTNQTATVTGDLYNVPLGTTTTLGSAIASATGSTVTVTNEVVDVTGTLTATAAAPLISLQSSTLASRTLALVQTGSLSLTGGPLLETVGGTASTTDDLLRVTGGGALSGPGTGPLLSLSGTALNVGNGSGDRLLELTGAGSSVGLGGALLDASGSTVSLTGTSLVEVSTGAALATTGASPLVGLTGGALVLNSAATGFLFSSATGSTLGGGLLQTSSTDINAGIAAPGNLLSVSGPLDSPSTSPLLSLAGGNVRARNLGVVTSATGVLTLGGAFLERSGASGSLVTTDDLLNVAAGGRLAAGGTGALLRFTDTTVNIGNASGDQLFQLTGAGSAATLGGGLLDASNTAFTLTGSSLVDVSTGAVLTATGTGPLAALSGGSLSLGGAAGFAISSTGASQIAGSLLRTANTAVATTGDLVSVSGSLTDTASSPLLDLTGGAVSARNGVLVSTANGRLTLNGPALARAGGTLSTTDDLFNVSSGGRLVNTGTGALLGFSSAAVNVGNATSDQLFVVTGAGSGVSLAGPVLDATATTFTLTGPLVEVSSGATLSAPSASPLTSLSGGSLSLGAGTGFLFSSTGPSTIGGSLLGTTGADLTTTGNLVTVSGPLTDTGTAALLDLTGGTVSARTGLAISSATGRLVLNGPALGRTGGSFTVTDDLLSITAGGRLTDTGTGALLAFTGGSVNIGNGSGDQLFVVNGAGSRATLAGPLLSVAASALSFTGTALVEVSTGATLTDTAAARVVSLSGGTLTLSSAANAFLLNTSGTATLTGGLLDTTGTDITAAGDFVRALGGGRLVVLGSTAPLLSLTGGAHQFGATGNIYRLSGTATAVDPVSGLTLGTEEPIQAAGSLFEAIGATAATQRAIRLDTALLQASAPLLSLRANGGIASQLTTSTNAIDLTTRVRLNATAPVVALDGSRLTVTSGSLVNVASGSYLGVTGHLLSVANGSQITVANGTLLFAAGGSVVNISGALLSFGGTGSTVTVNNALCPCTVIGGIPVRLSGGALAANVSITNAIQNAAGNTVSVAAGAAAIRVDGATTKVTISGQ
jgi:hypothetical protein